MCASPNPLECPISFEVFRDPVVAEDGITYEREAITKWIQEKGISPMTRQPLTVEGLRSNRVVKDLIESRASITYPATAPTMTTASTIASSVEQPEQFYVRPQIARLVFNNSYINLSRRRIANNYVPYPKSLQYDELRWLCANFQSKFQAVTKLDLSQNEFIVDHANIIAQMLSINRTITDLNLFGNLLRDDGAIIIAQVFLQGKNRTLLVLNLGNNQIQTRGGEALAAVIRSNDTLKQLSLALNVHIGKEETFYHAIIQNSTMIRLDLSDTSAIRSSTGEYRINEKCKDNRGDNY